MIYFLFGAAFLLAGLLAVRWLADTEPRNIKRALALFAAVVLVVLAVAMAATGRFVVSVPFLMAAFVAWRRYKMARGFFKAAADWQAGRGQGAKERAKEGAKSGSAMSRQEAYEVLGLEPDADETAIRKAHHELLQKVHPDHGGSTYLATRINQAKDVLLKR